MHPKRWRLSRGLTLAKAAAFADYHKSNPARAWQRWETGEREPPLSVVHYILERTLGETEGAVFPIDWLEARRDWLVKNGANEE